AIGAAYRRRARVLHPDIPNTGSTEAFLALRAAYEILSDPDRRRAYDRAARPTPDPPRPAAPSPAPPAPNRFALWAGFLVASAALAAFAMLRLAEGPTADLPDHPGPPPAPWTGPPALPHARPAG
ncbi:MAG: DnaJ domain-containing protein, partial [Acetobacteraceae bacterium]